MRRPFNRSPQVVRPAHVGTCAYCYGGVWEDEPRMTHNGLLSSQQKGPLHLHLKCKIHYIRVMREAIDAIDDGVFS